MAKAGQPYTSGNWVLKEGVEEEFVQRWTDFVGWATENARGARSFYLIKDSEDPRHFISFGEWDDQDSIDAWRQRDEFREGLMRCRELCDDFRGWTTL